MTLAASSEAIQDSGLKFETKKSQYRSVNRLHKSIIYNITITLSRE